MTVFSDILLAFRVEYWGCKSLLNRFCLLNCVQRENSTKNINKEKCGGNCLSFSVLSRRGLRGKFDGGLFRYRALNWSVPFRPCQSLLVEERFTQTRSQSLVKAWIPGAQDSLSSACGGGRGYVWHLYEHCYYPIQLPTTKVNWY